MTNNHQAQSNGKFRSARENAKAKLQANPVTRKLCPPKGEVANSLTLILTIVAIFVTARTVLGPIADVGGTIFVRHPVITL